MILILTIVLVALVFEFINGFHEIDRGSMAGACDESATRGLRVNYIGRHPCCLRFVRKSPRGTPSVLTPRPAQSPIPRRVFTIS